MNALVPINIETTSNDPMDVVAQPDVQVILLPIGPTIPNEKRTFAPPSSPRDNIYISDDEDDNKKLPIVMDTDKIVITEDGDVQLTEPENMQVEDKPIIVLTDGTVALPPTQEMEAVKTRNIVLKRKYPEENQFDNIKMIKNESANITVRDVVPYSSETTVVSYENVKHPIQ